MARLLCVVVRNTWYKENASHGVLWPLEACTFISLSAAVILARLEAASGPEAARAGVYACLLPCGSWRHTGGFARRVFTRETIKASRRIRGGIEKARRGGLAWVLFVFFGKLEYNQDRE